MFSVCFRGELRSLTGQKQWDGSKIEVLLLREQQVLLQSVAIGIKVNAFFVKVAPEQDHRIFVETQCLDPPPITAFVEGSGFGMSTEGSPVTEHEAGHF